MPIAATLTAATPAQEFEVPRLPSPPRVLTLTISRIQNPLGQGFSLACTAKGSEGALIALGTVTPYPPEQGGTFTLSVPPPAAQTLASKTGQVKVRLALAPVAPDRPLAAPLEVTVSELTWR